MYLGRNKFGEAFIDPTYDELKTMRSIEAGLIAAINVINHELIILSPGSNRLPFGHMRLFELLKEHGYDLKTNNPYNYFDEPTLIFGYLVVDDGELFLNKSEVYSDAIFQCFRDMYDWYPLDEDDNMWGVIYPTIKKMTDKYSSEKKVAIIKKLVFG